MSRCLTIVFLLLTLLAPAIAVDRPFKQMSPVLQQALLEKDLLTLEQHIDLYGIVLAKVKKLKSMAEKKSGVRYKLFSQAVGISEPVLATTISRIVIKEYKLTPRAVVKGYLARLKIEGIGEQGKMGYAYGTFLGKPFYLGAVKTNGRWLIIRAESEVVDHELEMLLRALRKAE